MAQASTTLSRISRYNPLSGKVIHEVQPQPGRHLILQKERVTTAELLTLFSVGKLLIPAPGPGLSISVVRVTLRYISDGIAFTNTDVSDLEIYYDGLAGTSITFINDTRSGVNGVESQWYVSNISSAGQTDVDATNKGVYLVRASSDLTNDSNTTSYMDVYVNYYIIDS